MAVELQKDLSWPLALRLSAGAEAQRRTHPFFQHAADRKSLWGRGDWQPAESLRTGATLKSEALTLAGYHDTVRSLAADARWDTRPDPMLPGNALVARASTARLYLASGSLTRTEFEARGYIALHRQSVLVVRALREDLSGPAPPSLKAILGGENNLRGYRAGTAVGDTLVAGALELRVPLSSPLGVARVGVTLFVDTAVVYDEGQRLPDQQWKSGAGGEVWLTAAIFRVSLTAAHGIGAGTRARVGAGLAF